MKSTIANDILFIYLNENDAQLLASGTTVIDRYDGEHKVHVSVLPEHLVKDDIPWNHKIADPRVTFSKENNDYDVNISLCDAKNAFMKWFSIGRKFIMNTSSLQKIILFMPSGEGYFEEELKVYKCQL